MNVATFITTVLVPKAAAFERLTGDPIVAQRRALLKYLARNARTGYGREHGFSSISSTGQFRSRVPISGCEAVNGAASGLMIAVRNFCAIGVGEAPAATSRFIFLVEFTQAVPAGRARKLLSRSRRPCAGRTASTTTCASSSSYRSRPGSRCPGSCPRRNLAGFPRRNAKYSPKPKDDGGAG